MNLMNPGVESAVLFATVHPVHCLYEKDKPGSETIKLRRFTQFQERAFTFIFDMQRRHSEHA